MFQINNKDTKGRLQFSASNVFMPVNSVLLSLLKTYITFIMALLLLTLSM